MSKPIVSVVMSVHNGEPFLREAVDSILTQSFREFEFIVIDDGSTDGSAAILDSCLRRDSRMRVYHQTNRGLVESLNRGCALARGKYIARMDADDISVADRLMWQLHFMQRHPAVGVVGGFIQCIGAKGKPLKTSVRPAENHEVKSALAHTCVLCHPTVLMRRDVFTSIGGYRKALADAEDYDLWLRVAERFQLANLPVVVLKYRIHPSQVTMRKCRQQALSSLAALAAVAARRSGKPDPLDSIAEITPAVLVELGVNESVQRATMARYSLGCIRKMYNAGEYSTARHLVEEALTSFDWKYAETWIISDIHLFMARLLWRQGRLGASMRSAGQAIMMRPRMVGRPLKPFLASFARWLSTLGTIKAGREHC